MPSDKLLKTLRPCCAKEVTDWCAVNQGSNFENVSLHCNVCTQTITYQVATGWIARTGDTMPTSITVEACLAELREMFPGKVIFFKDEIEWWAEDSEPCRATVIGIDYPPSNQKKFTGDSLSECMAQVRAWKDSQQ